MIKKRWCSREEVEQLIAAGTGKGVKVAVLDSGIEIRHNAFTGRSLADDIVVLGEDIPGTRMRRLAASEGRGVDVFGHGTAVAGVIWEVAPEAQLGSFRVLGEDNRSKTDIVCFAARLAIEQGYHIINCSLGCGRPEHLVLYKTWVDEAYISGVHVVAACNNVNFRRPEWPGYFPSVVTVNMARTSDRLRHFYRGGHLVEFAASGVDIEVPWRYGRTLKTTGSSFATPRVAGLLARMLSVFPDLHPLEAKSMLRYLAESWTHELSAPNET